jgi:hypothetical protein
MILGLLAQPARAQTDIYRSITPIWDQAVKEIDWIQAEEQEYEIVYLEIGLLFSDSERNSKEILRTLQEGWTYGIYAFGDWRINNLDIFIYEKSEYGYWSLALKNDDLNDDRKDVPLLVFKPEKTKEYKIMVTAQEFAEDYNGGHYGFIIFHQ